MLGWLKEELWIEPRKTGYTSHRTYIVNVNPFSIDTIREHLKAKRDVRCVLEEKQAPALFDDLVRCETLVGRVLFIDKISRNQVQTPYMQVRWKEWITEKNSYTITLTNTEGVG